MYSIQYEKIYTTSNEKQTAVTIVKNIKRNEI